MPTGKEADENYLEAKRYLAQFPLGTAEMERDYCAQWMGNSNAYQRSLNGALAQLEEAGKLAMEMRATIERLSKQLRDKDTSFKNPITGQA